jgi:hypothetical protein
VIHVAADHLPDEPRARGRVIGSLPARELVEHVETELVGAHRGRRVGVDSATCARAFMFASLMSSGIIEVLRARQRAAGLSAFEDLWAS